MMVMVKNYSERLEIAFWEMIIPLMRESRLVQAFLPTALALLYQKQFRLRMVKILVWAWAGLILGMVLGFFKAGLS